MRSHTINWYMVATLGVSIVIAGQFSGWNLGLANGWKNMLLGTALMFLFYVGFLQLISEMGSTWPSAGGLAKYTSLAFGKMPGGLVNVSMAIALIAGTGIVGGFIASYGETVLGINGLVLKGLLFFFVLILHLAGTKEAMWVVILAGLVAVFTLLGFAAVSLPHFDITILKRDQSSLSLNGVISVLPFSLWMFIGVEQAVTASEEARSPGKDLPRGLTLALIILCLTAAGVLFGALGLGHIDELTVAGDPLLATLNLKTFPFMHSAIGFGAIFGLIASFFSLSYSASRQVFDLSRTQFFPEGFSTINHKGIPVKAFLFVMVAGFGVSFIHPEKILLAMVLLFTATYLITALAYIRLRYSHVNTPRRYHARGGKITGYITIILASLIFYACFSADVLTMSVIGSIFTAVIAYHVFKRKKIMSLVSSNN